MTLYDIIGYIQGHLGKRTVPPAVTAFARTHASRFINPVAEG